jgi:tetratricopeptide (TPR) repeat protein
VTVKTWGDLLDEVRQAIASRDWDAGEIAIEMLRREAEHQGNPGTLASAAFYTGMFHDARGALDAAEASFSEAVSWDERAHGPEHQAVADALRSLGMVQVRRKRADAAVRSYERAARIYEADGKRVAGLECRRLVAQAWLVSGRLDESFAGYADVLARIAGASDLGSRAERVNALVGQCECQRRGRRFEVAYTLACEATREGASPVDDTLRSALARAWAALAFLCRHAFRREEEAVLAYALARDLTRSADLRASTSKAIAESPDHAALGRERVEGPVVATITSGGEAGVFDPERGVVVADGAAGCAVGDRVRLHREAERFTLVRVH